MPVTVTFDSGQAYAVLILGIAVAVVSTTVTKSAIFGPLRVWIDGRASLLGDLFHCPYCMAHWVALLTVILTEPFAIVSASYALDCAVATLLLTFVASIGYGMIRWAFSQEDEE